MEDHWFDTLNKALVRENPRRTLLGAAAAAITSLGLITQPESALGKKGKNGKNGNKGHRNKKKNKHKRKGQYQLCAPEILEECHTPYLASGTPEDCEDKCERCQKAGTAFCLVPSGGGVLSVRPTCCHSADECCGSPFAVGDCCTSDRCCDDGDGDRFCAPSGEYCCRNGTGGTCPHGHECCGDRCVAPCEAPLVLDPVSCECVDLNFFCHQTCVGPGLRCCQGNCVDIRTNPGACGGCDRRCAIATGEQCCGGTCVDVRFGNAQCGGDCEPCGSGQECCDYICIDPQDWECCHAPESSHPWQRCPRVTHHCCSRDGLPSCCQNE